MMNSKNRKKKSRRNFSKIIHKLVNVNVIIKLIEKFNVKLIKFYQFFSTENYSIIIISFLNKEIKNERSKAYEKRYIKCYRRNKGGENDDK